MEVSDKSDRGLGYIYDLLYDPVRGKPRRSGRGRIARGCVFGTGAVPS